MKDADAYVLVFDVEGTLIDCVPQTIESWRQTLAEHAFHFSHEELHRYSGMDAKLMLSGLLPDADKKLRKSLLDEQGERYRKKFLPQVSLQLLQDNATKQFSTLYIKKEI